MVRSIELIKELENQRGSKVVTYVTSDRSEPLGAKIASDVVRLFYEHLRRIGKVKQIDLFLYSRGGDTITPWRIVSLFREFCDKFIVMVPFRAHSAATLIALGADEIVMGPLGELSPIDPSIGTPFNPPHPDNPKTRLEIGVEDVIGYVNLAKEKVGITDQDNLVRVFEKLSDRIHPLALGGVYRSYSLIRLLAEKMLKLHMQERQDAQRVPQIVSNIVEGLYYHGYLISRDEAEGLGLKVKKPVDKEEEELMWSLYLEYEKRIGLGKPFNPLEYLEEGKDMTKKEMPIALIESSGLSSGFYQLLKISKPTAPVPGPEGLPPPQIGVQAIALGWRTAEVKEG